MRNTVIWSFLSLLALATGGLVTGCDSDAKIAKSSPGESCTKTSDCNDGLKCLNGTCYSSSSVIDKSGDGGESGGDEPIFVPPIPPNLGKLGETCTKRSDCDDGLACLSSRCSDDETVGAGGSGSGPGPTLGGPGETCGLTTDCADGLACLPTEVYLDSGSKAKALGNGGGVCTSLHNGLTANGSSCGGECKTATDCCELPVALHQPYSATDIPGTSGEWGTGASSCAQLTALLDGVDCDTTKAPEALARCFAQATYCDCSKTTWTCSDAGRCQYNAVCDVSGAKPGGCPHYTRLSLPAATQGVCDTDSDHCVPAAAACKKDTDCDETVTPTGGTGTCADATCACDKAGGLCYRSCDEDLDCPNGSSCDTKTHLCMTGNECDTDSACVVKYNDINYQCTDGTCMASCSTDLDCNYGSLTNGANTQICNADGLCEPVGCESDDQCPAGEGGVRTFCIADVEPSGEPSVVSAITD